MTATTSWWLTVGVLGPEGFKRALFRRRREREKRDVRVRSLGLDGLDHGGYHPPRAIWLQRRKLCGT
jgi:hypothetical protein